MPPFNKRTDGGTYGDLVEKTFDCGFRTAKLRGRPDDEIVQAECQICGSICENWRTDLEAGRKTNCGCKPEPQPIQIDPEVIWKWYQDYLRVDEVWIDKIEKEITKIKEKVLVPIRRQK